MLNGREECFYCHSIKPVNQLHSERTQEFVEDVETGEVEQVSLIRLCCDDCWNKRHTSLFDSIEDFFVNDDKFHTVKN